MRQRVSKLDLRVAVLVQARRARFKAGSVCLQGGCAGVKTGRVPGREGLSPVNGYQNYV